MEPKSIIRERKTSKTYGLQLLAYSLI